MAIIFIQFLIFDCEIVLRTLLQNSTDLFLADMTLLCNFFFFSPEKFATACHKKMDQLIIIVVYGTMHGGTEDITCDKDSH